jgi:hypothetical protein
VICTAADDNTPVGNFADTPRTGPRLAQVITHTYLI